MAKVCVIGSGVSGLGAAWLLSQKEGVEVTVFEERHQAGGHANTVDIDGFPVDTGFLVFNEATYPNLIRLFEHLNVKSDPSDMSFSVSMRGKTMEWSSDAKGVLATPSNLVSPSYWQMFRDVVRFNTEAPRWLEDAKSTPDVTLGEFLEAGKYSAAFCDYYLFPMIACVWSATAEDVMNFPARTLIRFFVNHHLVSLEKPQWRTVSGRSRAYVRAISEPYRSRLFLNTPVTKVVRKPRSAPSDNRFTVESHFDCHVTLKDGSEHVFDHVVFACHPDQALRILGEDATADEREVLGAFLYDENIAYLHTDASLMPARKSCWTSWNFIGYGKLDESSLESAKAGASEACCITYWLNRLQNFSSEDRGDIFVTLNPPRMPAEGTILQTFQYSHPQYTKAAIRAQSFVDSKLQGQRSTWFTGAYLGYGFHEDGLTSGLRAAYRIHGIPAPWWKEAGEVKTPLDTEAASLFQLAAPDCWNDEQASAGYLLATSADIGKLNVYGSRHATETSEESTTVGFSSIDGDESHCDEAMSVGKSSQLDEADLLDGSTLVSTEAAAAASKPSLRTSGSKTALSLASHAAKPASDTIVPSPSTRLAPMGINGSPVVWFDPWASGSRRSVKVVGAGAQNSTFGEFVEPDYRDVPGTIMHYRSKLWESIDGFPKSSNPAEGVGAGYTPMEHSTSKVPSRSVTDCCSLSGLMSWTSSFSGWCASFPVLDLFRRGVKEGCVVFREPDGFTHLFGDALAPADMRAELHVHDSTFFLRAALEADLGIAREFMAGHWSCDNLASLFRIFIANRDRDEAVFRSSSLWTASVGRLLNFASFRLFLDNSIAGSRSNIHAHYDLSNGLFETFLDPTSMSYSCARFRTDGTDERTGKPRFFGSLDDAQVRKLDQLINLARVRSHHKVLDLGFGWGGLSIRLAQTTGCRVHGITLSKEQKSWAEKRVEALGLQDKITFELIDYREFAEKHRQEFDRIITVEMIEAVGHSYLGTFMKACSSILKPTGLMVMQAITLNEPRYDEYIHSVDFINTVIFPGGQCPCVSSLLNAMSKNSDMVLSFTDNHALHYAETLRIWRRNFNARLQRVRALGFDDTFIRTWNYYLAYCEAGFDTETLGLHTLVFSKPKAPQSV